MSMIEVKNVSAGYDGKEILHSINLSVNKGESISIIGKNGCGKSTLLRTMCGVLDFTGDVIIDGINIKKYKSKDLAKKVCMLSQTTQVYFNYTVYDTIMMGRYAHQKSSIFGSVTENDRVVVENALKTVDMYDLKDSYINTLSGGQLQRVFLAKVIAQDPEILLLDEPTNHLDIVYQIELIKFLKNWSKEQGKTVIGVIHDLNLAMELSENIVLMDNGQIKCNGSSETVFTSNEFKEVYDVDVVDFMVNSYKKWYNIGNIIKTQNNIK